MPVVIDDDFLDGADTSGEIQRFRIEEGGASSSTFFLNFQEVDYFDDAASMVAGIEAAIFTYYGDQRAAVVAYGTASGYHYFDLQFGGIWISTEITVGTLFYSDNDTGCDGEIIDDYADHVVGSPATHNFAFDPIPTAGEWTLDGNTFDWNETPTVTGWYVTGNPSSGLVECTKTTDGDGVTPLTFSVGTLEAAFTAAAGLVGSSSSMSASATYAAGTKTAAVALTKAASSLVSVIDVSQPVAITTLTGSTTLLSAAGDFDVPVYTGSVALSLNTTTLAASSSFAPGTKTAAVALTHIASVIASTGSFVTPVFTAGATLLGRRSILRAREVELTSGPKVYVHAGRRSVVMYGVSDGKFKFSLGGHSSGRRNHSIHLVQVKPEIVTIEAEFKVLTLSPVIPAGAFRYEAQGGYLIIENMTDIELTLVPDEGLDDFVSTAPAVPDIENGVLFSTFPTQQYN